MYWNISLVTVTIGISPSECIECRLALSIAVMGEDRKKKSEKEGRWKDRTETEEKKKGEYFLGPDEL